MEDEVQAEATTAAEPVAAPEAAAPDAKPSDVKPADSKPAEQKPLDFKTLEAKLQEAKAQQDRPKREERPKEERPKEDRPKEDRPRGDRPPREGGGQHAQGRGPRPEGQGRPEGRGGGERRPEGNRGGGGDEQRRDRREGGPRPGGMGGGRPFDNPEIEIEKLISDSLYLDNQAHAVVARMRDMDSGTKSQLRRLYNAVRRAVRAPESERQHQFVMLRARLAYTIARHSLRSLDALERLLLQVTRKNDARGYERFKDLFEAIVAYNE
jgi:CRISPR type III-A-associated protein Csm2